MNILYIFGNGFDKAQGMKTSYPEFYKYLMNNSDACSPLFQKMIQEIKADKELWSDMEVAFGQFTSSIKNATELEELYFELSDFLQQYLKIEDDAFAPSDNLKNKFVDDLLNYGKYLGATDLLRYSKYLDQFTGMKDISIMTLNYTKTIEKLLTPLGRSGDRDFGGNRYLRQIIHVHGVLDDSIIVGVDNDDQIANESFKSNVDIKDFIVKNQSNIVMKYTRSLICEDLIRNANLIILYGVSLGETDNRWWKLIGEQLKTRKNLSIIQYIYMKKALSATRKHLTGQIDLNSATL